MFLSKRSNGYYYIFYDNQYNKKTCISTKTKFKKEALYFLSNFEAENKKRRKGNVIPILLKDFAFSYLKYSESIHRPKTTKSIKTIFKELLNHCGNIQLSEITAANIQNFLNIKSEVSKYTSQKYLAYLRSAFNKAVKDNYLLDNPCSEIKNYKIPEKQPLFFSEIDFEILLRVIDKPDIRDLVEFAVNTGLRQMELLTLEWNQINFKDKSLILDNRNHLTKSKKIRTIPLNIKAMQVLTNRELNKTSGGLIFTLNSNPISQDFISKKFKKYVLRAGLNNKLNFHSLRHTFASWLIQRGASIYSVSKLLGHSDIKVTEIYAHLRSEDLMNSVNKLNN